MSTQMKPVEVRKPRRRTGRVWRWTRRLAWLTVGLAMLGCLVVLALNETVKRQGGRYIVQADKAPATAAILVLGAAVYPDGRVSPMLHDRLQVAYDLYKLGKAPKIIVSGDHGKVSYDEVHAMRAFLMERGVPAQDVFMDHAGFSTYESVYRAKAVFEAERLLIVTQDYHLRRAVYIARRLGLEAYGVASDLQSYRGMNKYELREIAARNKDFLFVNVLKPKPTYLGDVIPVTGDGTVTDDRKG